MTEKRGSLTGGLVLIALGLAFLAMQFFEQIGGSVVLLSLGAAFLTAHFIYRAYGLLIPGCILLGLGAGLLAEETSIAGAISEPVVVGLGTGFLLIWVIDRVFARRGPRGSWWPLIPASILLLVGLAESFGNVEDVFPFILGAGLVILGVVVIVRGMGKGSGDEGP